jgi:peptide/nickel transport system permease protein
VVGINLLGDGLRDALDPQERAGAEAGPGPSPDAARGVAPSSAQDTLLLVEDVRIDFGNGANPRVVVDELGFELAAGERLALVGESGSGKTQSALALLGLVPPPGRLAGGSIRLRAEELAGGREAQWQAVRGRSIAYVPQDPMSALDPLFTIGEQLVETLRLESRISRSDARERAEALLGQVRLPDPGQLLDVYPHELSGGMRQRVMIALGIAHDPDVLITDEATTALDVTIQAEILALLDKLCRERNMALIFITHDLALVGELCDRVLVLYAGRPVEELGVDQLFAGPAHPYTRALLDCTPVLGRPDKSLQPIAGAPPDLDALPTGCHFAPRCRYVEPACREEPIVLRPLKAGHQARCRRAEELEL